MGNENKMRICPVCGKHYTHYPSISRRDNKTMICPDCGTKEALEDSRISVEEQKEILDMIHKYRKEIVREQKAEERWKKCSKCGGKIGKVVALSKINNSIICEECGRKELLNLFRLAQIFYPDGLNSIEDGGMEEKGEDDGK